MSFHVFERGAAEDKVIVLEETETGTKAEIYAFGALLNVFSVKQNEVDKNVIYGFQNVADAKEHITPLFQSAKLSPFVCRMKEGSYTFANYKYKIEKYYNLREAIHGLLFDTIFSVTETGATNEFAFVKLRFEYNKTDAGYPFFYRVEITHTLRKNHQLMISTKVTNLSISAIPVADGWHPYFSFGKKVNDLQLLMNTKEIVEFDNKLLPTGIFTSYANFSEPAFIEETRLDHCFVLEENIHQPACSVTDLEDKIRVNIYAKKNYPFLQIFIPDNRSAIAIENLSSIPDSFNNAVGLSVLEPSQSKEFVCVYEIQTF